MCKRAGSYGMTIMQRLVGALLLVLVLGAYSLAWASDVDRPFEDLVVEAEVERKGQNSEFGYGALWVRTGFTVTRIDAGTYTATEISLPGASQRQRGIAVGEGAVWIGDIGKKVIFKVDPVTSEVTLEIPAEMSSQFSRIAVGEGSVWTMVVGDEGFETTLARFDAESGALQASVDLPSTGIGMVYGNGSVWVVSGQMDELYRVDVASDTLVSTTKLGDSPGLAAFGAGAVWVHNLGDATVQRVDAKTGEVIATIDTGLPYGPSEVAFGGGFVWMNAYYRVPVLMLDPASNAVVRRYHGAPIDRFTRLTYGDGSLWVGGARSILRLRPPM
jgi:streptogramin lyase